MTTAGRGLARPANSVRKPSLSAGLRTENGQAVGRPANSVRIWALSAGFRTENGRRAWRRRAQGVAVGIVADRLLGEPPLRPHPVAAFGTAMAGVEGRLYADRRVNGVVHAAIGLTIGAGAGAVVRLVAPSTYLAVAGRALAEAAADVSAALDAGDLDQARRLLPSLVGRDPSGLDADGVARAVIESVAENTVDAVVAPALWGLVAGAPGVLGHRAVNTLDAMVGHRSDRYRHYGTASARLDDLAAWVPARLTAALVAAVRPRAAGAVWRAVRTDAPAHPSPNSGVAEAAFAAALGLRLGGEVRYGTRVEQRPSLGDGKPPTPADIAAALRLADHVGLALTAFLAAGSFVGARRRSGRHGATTFAAGAGNLPNSGASRRSRRRGATTFGVGGRR